MSTDVPDNLHPCPPLEQYFQFNRDELAFLLKNQLVLPMTTFFFFFMLAEDLCGEPNQGTDVG